jgi:hypothetical protein
MYCAARCGNWVNSVPFITLAGIWLDMSGVMWNGEVCRSP